MIELDFRGLHLHAFQVDRFRFALQECVFGIAYARAAPSMHFLRRERDQGRLVAVGLHAQQHFRHVASLGGDPVDGRKTVARLILAGASAVHGHSVLGQQCDFRPIYQYVGKIVFHLSDDHTRLVLTCLRLFRGGVERKDCQ